MKASHKRYDSKHKVTRIFLDDYLVIKGWARQADISMAEALHKLITRQPLPEAKPVAKPAFKVTGPGIALRIKPQPIIATNGSKVTAFRIKPKEVRYD